MHGMVAMKTCLAMAQMIGATAREVRVPERMAVAVSYIESRCDSTQVSSAGARGMMQVMEFWVTHPTWSVSRSLSRRCGARTVSDLHKAQVGICMGVRILRYYYAHSGRDWDRALARYSGNTPAYAMNVRRVMRGERPVWPAPVMLLAVN